MDFLEGRGFGMMNRPRGCGTGQQAGFDFSRVVDVLGERT